MAAARATFTDALRKATGDANRLVAKSAEVALTAASGR
jgi:hypothetical protein